MLSLAWRNVWRQRWRSLVTAGSVALVVWLSIVFFSFGGAATNSFYTRLTETSGHVQLRVQGWRDATGLSETLVESAAAIREGAAEATGQSFPDATLSAVLEVPALISGEVRSRGALLVGREWPEEIRRRSLANATLEGRFLEGTGEVVLGASLANALDLGLGDELFVYAPEGQGFGATVLEVVGLVDMADPNQEIATVWTELAEAQELAAPDAVTRIEIHLPSLVRIEDDPAARQLAAELSALFPGLDALTWRELEPGLVSVLEALDPMLYGVAALFFILAGLLVLNTIYLSVMERIRELGVIHALGASGRAVLGLVTTESVFLCSLGAIVGGLLGLLTVWAGSGGFVIPGTTEYYASFGMDPVMYLSVTPEQVVFSLLFAVVTALLAALWPALLAARLEPVEAMRFQA